MIPMRADSFEIRGRLKIYGTLQMFRTTAFQAAFAEETLKHTTYEVQAFN